MPYGIPHGKLTNYATRVITVDDALPDVGSNLYAAFPIARELHELEGLTHGLRVMHQFGVPLFDNNSSIEERRAVYIVRDTGASALVAGSVMRDWLSSMTCLIPSAHRCGCEVVAWRCCSRGQCAIVPYTETVSSSSLLM